MTKKISKIIKKIICKNLTGHHCVIIPYKEYKEKNRIKLGLLAKKGTYKINDDFKMTAEELLDF